MDPIQFLISRMPLFPLFFRNAFIFSRKTLRLTSEIIYIYTIEFDFQHLHPFPKLVHLSIDFFSNISPLQTKKKNVIII